jgi:hypothetical protein
VCALGSGKLKPKRGQIPPNHKQMEERVLLSADPRAILLLPSWIKTASEPDGLHCANNGTHTSEASF